MPPSERSDQDVYDMHALGKDLKEINGAAERETQPH